MENEDSTSVAWPLYQAQPLRLISPGLLFKTIEELSEKKSSNEEAGLFSSTDNQIATAPHERKCVRKARLPEVVQPSFISPQALLVRFYLLPF
jgi:hypothetical protein